MSHDHDHHHHAHAPDHTVAFVVSVVLNVGFVLIEVFYGLLAQSTALVADAAHNAGDVLGLLLAWGATRLARIAPSGRRTYGWRKSTVVAALLNALLIMVAVGGVSWEAVGRFGAPRPPDGWTMIVVAAIGVGINAVSALLFYTRRKGDVNIEGAFLHLTADAAVSAGVVVAGAVVVWTGWAWIDPATSLVIAAVIVVATWSLLRESTQLLLDAVPEHIDLDEVTDALGSIEGVTEVHDLHVWAMSTRETSLTAHLGVCEGTDAATVLQAVETQLRERFSIGHTTVQLEPDTGDHGCDQGRSGHV